MSASTEPELREESISTTRRGLGPDPVEIVRKSSPASPGDPRRALRGYRRATLALDAAAAAGAAAVAVTLRFGGADATAGAGLYVLAPLLAPLLWVGAVAGYRAYETRFLGSGPEEFRRVLSAGLLSFTGVAVFSYTADGSLSRSVVLFVTCATLGVSLAGRRLLRRRLHRARARGHGMHRVLVVGRADAAGALVKQLDRQPAHGYVAAGVCVTGSGTRPADIHRVPVVGDHTAVLQAVDELGAHVVAVATGPDLSGQALRRLSWALDERGVELLVSPGIVEVAGPRLSIRPVAELSLLHLERPATTGGPLVLKSAFDRTLGTLLLLAITPLLAAIAVAVRLSSPGPALYRQTRTGVDGREFTIYKFRSMVVGADALVGGLAEQDEGNGVLFKVRADPRVTRVGRVLRRYSLDELPQLLNVVRGEMSLVGPRPPLPAEVAGYSADAVRRLRVRPGLTGLWQVSGRSDLSWEESLRLDLRYVDNWSLSLDLVILWRTARAVIRGKGAY